MKKRFTQLLSNKMNSAKMLFFVLVMCGMSSASFATITVTPATLGANICSNTAANGSAPAYTTLDAMTITEGAVGDLGNNAGAWTVTITINAPAGWGYNTASTVTFTPTVATGDITSVAQTGLTANSLTVKISGSGNINMDVITITGLQVRPTTITSANGNITPFITGGTATGISNFSTNFGSLSLSPQPISGTTTVCVAGVTNLSDVTVGGTWGSSATTIATVTSGGVVTGVTGGTSVIDYTVAGCVTTRTVTVHDAPGPISGITTFCSGVTTTLSDPTTGGTWSSGTTSVATVVNINAGTVKGATAGTAIITYSIAACPTATVAVTVNALPVITGTLSVCTGLTTTLSSSITGGTWSSATTTVATINSGSGIVTGDGPGTSVITYTVTATGCTKTATVTDYAPPSAITGITTVCTGATTQLTNTVTGGTWSSGTTADATVTNTGLVTGVNAGTPIISYTSNAACPSATVAVTVNTTPTAILGGATVICQQQTMALSDALGGGAWASSNNGRATVTSPGGVVTGVGTGTVNISYTVTGCSAVRTMTVNLTPAVITGTKAVCTGFTTNLSDVTAGGTWLSGTIGVATVNGTGVISGVTSGTSVISYQIAATGCQNTTTVTVNQSPNAIVGVNHVCVAQTTQLSDATAGGTWLSSSNTTASVNTTGNVTGNNAGVVTITYTEPLHACIATASVTVNAVPSTISGTTTVCQTAVTSLSNTSAGGMWISDNTTVATVDNAGNVSGVSGGTADITYEFGATCFATTTVTVNPLPDKGVISGSATVCVAAATTLSETETGGTWSSDNNSIATVDNAGVVTGVAVGNTTITYTVSNPCGLQFATAPMTVQELTPLVSISGNPGLTSCVGQAVTYTAVPVNGGSSPVYEWKVNGSIVSTTNTYSYTPVNGDLLSLKMTSNASCLVTTVANTSVNPVVNPNLTPVVTISAGAGGDTVCIGTSTTYTATPINGGSTPAYQWLVNGSIMATGNPFVYIPNGGDIISAELISSYECPVPASVMSNSVTMTVDVTETPTVAITVNPSNPSCEGSPVTYSVQLLYGGITPFIRWTQNGINVATGPQYITVPTAGETVYCMMESSSSCRTADSVFSNTITMAIDTPVTPNVVIAAQSYILSIGQNDTLTATVTPVSIVFPTYQWYFNGVIIPGATSKTYVVTGTAAETDYYYCIAGSGNACNTSHISNLVSLGVVPAGVNTVNTEVNDLQLVPNPNKGTFAIQGTMSNNDNVQIEITNVIGQVVYKSVADVQNQHLNQQINMSSSLTNGVYLLHVMSNNAHKVIRFSLER